MSFVQLEYILGFLHRRLQVLLHIEVCMLIRPDCTQSQQIVYYDTASSTYLLRILSQCGVFVQYGLNVFRLWDLEERRAVHLL
jgi:hypothetical protein